MRADLAAAMPGLIRHRGLWRGIYRHIDSDGALLDQHDARVHCAFPDSGAHAYIQTNHFRWADGRESVATLPGVFRDGQLWWDTPTFHGRCWETMDGLLLLNLTRKDEPGAHFIELIVLGESGRHRARTWHWFRDGQLYRRTLCDETLVDPDA